MNHFKLFLISFLICFACGIGISCKTTSILPEKQKGFNSDETKIVEMETYFAKIGRKKIRQKIICKFYGSLKDDIFTVNEMYWFDNWTNGWTEAKFAVNGKLKISKRKSYHYEVVSPLEIEFPIMAKIRIKDTVLLGDDAIKALQNRYERIISAIDLLKDENAEFKMEKGFIDYPEFEKTIGKILFPEVYGFQKKFQIYATQKKMGKDKGNFVMADGIFWNHDYTQQVFPEFMWDVRNSGTLYKDWEENTDLFYCLYNWEYYFGEKVMPGTLKKISW